MNLFTTPDILAVGFFILAWAVYAITLERTAHGRDGLNARMNIYREVWMRRMLDREVRIVDTQIMGSLQNGTAFFASTSLLAVGGALTLLKSTEEAMSVLSTLPLGIRKFAGAVGTEMRRADRDLRLRLLQIRLGVSFVQLRGNSARCNARSREERHT